MNDESKQDKRVFRVACEVVGVAYFEVEADSEQDAVDQVRYGEISPDDEEIIIDRHGAGYGLQEATDAGWVLLRAGAVYDDEDEDNEIDGTLRDGARPT